MQKTRADLTKLSSGLVLMRKIDYQLNDSEHHGFCRNFKKLLQYDNNNHQQIYKIRHKTTGQIV